MSTWIEDERDQSRVLTRKPNKDALASMTVPFGYFLAILEVGIKSRIRATKDMGPVKAGLRVCDANKLIPHESGLNQTE